jgi:hypothetical protein
MTDRDVEKKTSAWAADLTAGHSIGVSEINYAQQPDGMTSATTKAYFIRVSKGWGVLQLALSTELDKKFV